MAQGSNRAGGKSRPASGRGQNNGRAQGGRGRGGTTGQSSGQTSGQGSGRAPASGRSGAKNRQQSAAAAQRAIQGARGKTKFFQVFLPIIVVAAVAAAVVVGVLVANNHAQQAGVLPTNGDTSADLLANTAKQSTGDPTSDGVKADNAEQILFHIHAHLSVFINGKEKKIPYGIGIVPPYQMSTTGDGAFVNGGSKFYYLHVHDETGVIHIESPVQRTYTLGNFFNVWRQPLSPNQIGPNTGKVTAIVDGKNYTGDPRDIPLNAHSVIQLEIGQPVAFQPYTFGPNL